LGLRSVLEESQESLPEESFIMDIKTSRNDSFASKISDSNVSINYDKIFPKRMNKLNSTPA